MAATNTTGLSQFAHYTDPVEDDNKGPFTDLESQTDLYMKIIKNVTQFDNDFTDSTTYESTVTKPGINNTTTESDVFTSDGTYSQTLQANGSAILAVNGKQVGNQTTAQIEDFKAYDAYFTEGQ